MDIIAHTASLKPDRKTLLKLKSNLDYTKIELDFRLTKDDELVWSHSPKINGEYISYTNYRSLGNVLTLEDVLEIFNHEKALIIELKGYPKNLENRYDILLKCLSSLYYYHNLIEVESFNERLIKSLLELQRKGELSFVQYGLIINLFKTFLFRKHFSQEYRNIQFIALSNELFEWPIVGGDYKIYREVFPQVREYAWSWDAVYKETEKRILNYITKGVDGIATSNPTLVKKLVK